MLTQSKGWAAGTVIAALVVGGFVGWGLGLRAGHGRWGGGPGRGPPPFGPGGGIQSYLKRKLDLTPVQEDSVHAIFERRRPQMEAMWRTVRSRFDSLRAAVDSEIGKQLTPTQRARFEELVRRHDERSRRGPPPEHR